MAKWKRTPVGSILKSKDATKSSYLKVSLLNKGSITLKHGQSLQVVSKKFKLEEVARLREEGRLPEETINAIEERANKMPDFVMAEVVLVERE